MADLPQRRRSSANHDTDDHHIAFHHESFDMFSSDYSTDPFPVADGYRTSQLPRMGPSSSFSPLQPTSRRSIALQTDSSMFVDPQKKSHRSQDSGSGLGPRNSFSLRHDAQYSDLPRRITSLSSTSEMTEASTMRPLSTASQLSIPRPLNSYVSASAPSHPYGLYHQNASMNRQSTASTLHPLSHRSLSNAQRPTHPYGMYLQSTEDSETDPLHSSTDIASVGFPGLNQQYARRVESGAEEADDIIGPEGHTEQLPPYSRYPDGSQAGPLPPKQRAASSLPPGSRISHISTDTPQTANSASSMTDALLVNRAPIDGISSTPSNDSGPQDQSKRERLAGKSKQRTCFGHLPVWAVVLMLILLVAAAAVVGGLIGRFFHHSSGSTDSGAPHTAGNGSDTQT